MELFYSVCGGWVSCGRVAGSPTGCVRCCSNVRHYSKCGSGEVSVHEVCCWRWVEDADVRNSCRGLLACTSWIVRNRIAGGLHESG